MLSISHLNAFYGQSHVLHGVDLEIAPGQVVALIGRNGVGRSTLVKSIMREVRTTGGISFEGRDITALPTHLVARAGISYVPEHREIFPGLTVSENLKLAKLGAPKPTDRWTHDVILRIFPNLAERLHTDAGVLSGGEQQMLAIARALVSEPKLVLVDEPTEGLAPRIVEQIAGIMFELKKSRLSILLVEQKLNIALDVADRIYVMGHGKIVFRGTPAEFRAAPEVRKQWLEV